MRRATAEVEAFDGGAIQPGAAEGTVVTDLPVFEGADEEVGAALVGEVAFSLERREREAVEDCVVGEIRGVLAPLFENRLGMS